MIHHGRRHEIFVRHDALDAVVVSNNRIASIDLRDAPAKAGGFHEIPDLDRAVDQNDEPRDVVRGDLLQSEAKADAQSTAEDGEHRKVDAHRSESEDDGEDHEEDVNHPGDHDL